MVVNDNNPKIWASLTAPNPDDITYWVDLTADPHGNIIKFYDEGEAKWLNLTSPTSDYAVYPYIGPNGNWFIENKDSGISASGEIPDATINGYLIANNPVLTKGDIGLGNVANLAPEDYPVPDAVYGLIDGKVDETRTINGHSLATDVTITKGDIGLGSVENISSADMPISTATATALSGKADATRNIVAGTGLTGGGNLTVDRALNVVSATDGITVNADNIQLNTNNTLISTSTTQPLSAAQGKVLNDKNVEQDAALLERPIMIDPTGDTITPSLGAYSKDESDALFVAKTQVVQTEGTSTTNVMSQKAVTDELTALETDLNELELKVVDYNCGTCTDLADAISKVPQLEQKGGLKIRFNNSSKVISYTLITSWWSPRIEDWVNVSEIANKTEKITAISFDTAQEEQLYTDDSFDENNQDETKIYAKIGSYGLKAKDLFYKDENGNYVNIKNAVIGKITSSTTENQEEEEKWVSDDYDENGNGELYGSRGSYGIKAKAFLDIDGNPINQEFVPDKSYNGYNLPRNPEALKILFIGNSYSQMALDHMVEWLPAMGIRNVRVCHTFHSGFTLQGYWESVENDLPICDLYCIEPNATYDERHKIVDAATGEELLNGESYISKLIDVFKFDEWDVISFQQGSVLSGNYESVSQYLDKLIETARYYCPNSGVKIAWNMTHAWAKGYDMFQTYGYIDQNDMFSKILNVSNLVQKNHNIDLIFPSGTVMQNLRSISNSFLDTITTSSDKDPRTEIYKGLDTWVNDTTMADFSGDGSHPNYYGFICICGAIVQLTVAACFGKNISSADIQAGWLNVPHQYVDSEPAIKIGIQCAIKAVSNRQNVSVINEVNIL